MGYFKKKIYERVNYTCECCNFNYKEDNSRGPIEAHESWEYDNVTKTQKLIRFVFCNKCHLATQYGYAQISGKGKNI